MRIDLEWCSTRGRFLLHAVGLALLCLAIQSSAHGAPIVITEFFNTNLRHYVLITEAAEVAAIEAGAAGPGWQKTGKSLNAYSDLGDKAGLVSVCRFYGSVSPGPNSHFFTADADECAAVKNDPGWHYEGIAFYVALPAGGQCATDQLRVWRAYNKGFKPDQGINDGNHRFSIDRDAIRTLIDALDWSDEGVVFCAQADHPGVPFRLSVSSASLRLLPGTTRDVFITVEPRNGFTGTAALSAAGLSNGVSHQFLPATASVGPNGAEVVLRLTVAESAPATPATAPPPIATVTATANGLSGLAGFELAVAPAGDHVAVNLNAIAAVEERARQLDAQAVSGLPFVQAIAAFMATRPEYEASGVDTETISAWGRLRDKRMHVVSDNLDPPSGTAASDVQRIPTKVGAELPAQTNARLLQPFGSGFVGQAPVNQMSVYLRSKNWNVRSGSAAEAYVGALKSVGGDGFFYFNTHGARLDVLDFSEPEGKMYALWSDTRESPLFDAVYSADLDALRLLYYTTRHFRPLPPGATNFRETRYGITYRFVVKYMTFTKESVVMINACWSTIDRTFINAFLSSGAGVYMGWSKRLHFAPAFSSGPYFVDRMLGANLHPDKESPPQRAFPYDLVLADMAKKALDLDPVSGAKLEATFHPALKYSPIFAPSIRDLQVNEWDEELTLNGEFGEEEPKVTVGGTPLALKLWSASAILAELPRTGPGSTGDVVVEVRNVKSNARQLTQWTIPLTYTWSKPVDFNEFSITGSGTIRYRADLAGYRTIPGEAPRFVERGGPPTKDSALTLTAAGMHPDGECTDILTGTGVYVSPPAYTGTGPVLDAFFRMAGDTRQGMLGMGLGALPTAPHTLMITGGPKCAGAFPFAAQLGRLEGNDTVFRDQRDTPGTVMLPVARFGLLADFSIPSKREIELGFSGEINVFWPAVPAETPPRDTADAGK